MRKTRQSRNARLSALVHALSGIVAVLQHQVMVQYNTVDSSSTVIQQVWPHLRL
jgi:hypothetical protein